MGLGVSTQYQPPAAQPVAAVAAAPVPVAAVAAAPATAAATAAPQKLVQAPKPEFVLLTSAAMLPTHTPMDTAWVAGLDNVRKI